MQTLLVYGDQLYNLRWNGNLACFDAASGDEKYRETVDTKSFIASPVAADGRIYTISEEGEVYIIEAGSSYRLINSIPLGEITLATPAIVDGMIIKAANERYIIPTLNIQASPAANDSLMVLLTTPPVASKSIMTLFFQNIFLSSVWFLLPILNNPF